MGKVQKWYYKQLDGCISGNGKPYCISLKKGTVNKLLVAFLGGGASWSEDTARNPITIQSLIKKEKKYYIEHVSPLMLSMGNVGLLSANDKRNPFHDWSIMNIAYSTGDFHIGCNDFPYKDKTGKDRLLHHHGAKNVETALGELSLLQKGTPDVLVVSGASAGAFGCLAHCPAIINIYPECKNIAVYTESAHLQSTQWQKILSDVWKVKSELTAYTTSADLVFDLFRYAQDNMPFHTRFLHSGSVWDEALTLFMYNMNHGGVNINEQALQQYHTTLIEVVKKLKNEISNYSYYLTDFGRKKDGSTPHVFSGSPKLLYNAMQDEVPLADWISQAISDKKPIDVGSRFLV